MAQFLIRLNRITYKVLFVFLMMAFSLLGLLLILQYSSITKSDALMRSALQQYRANVSHDIRVRQDAILLFLQDNSAWDEFVTTIQKPNQAWFENNLGLAAGSHNIREMWIYNLKLEMIYHKSGHENPEETLKPAGLEKLSEHLQTKGLIHYYQAVNGIVTEYFAATVIPSENIIDRNAPPAGYFIFSKNVDSMLLQSLSRSTDSKVSLETLSLDSTLLGPGDLYYSEALPDMAGEQVAWLNFVKPQKSLGIHFFNNKLISISLSLALFVCLLLSWVFLNNWVNKPIQKLVLALQQKDSREIETLLVHKDEFTILAKLVGENIDLRNHLALEIEERKKRAAELNELNKTKDKIFSIIGHDLISPFNTIIGFSSLILNSSASRDPERVREYTEMIHGTSREAFNMLETLLAWGRMQTGRMSSTPEPLDLDATVHAAVSQVNNQARLKGITMVSPIKAGMKVMADKNMLVTVLRNLLSNAVKFTPQSGNITVTAHTNHQMAVVEVADTGVGMTSEQIESLFRQDVIVTTRGTEMEKGTGLGLLLCYELVQRNGGELWVKSEPGKGSHFFFSVPLVV